jgi:hypothetical protein
MSESLLNLFTVLHPEDTDKSNTLPLCSRTEKQIDNGLSWLQVLYLTEGAHKFVNREQWLLRRCYLPVEYYRVR